ncbi:hypothetical protein MA16_Dca020179 [Dendrobium catenatum]|uniref:Uncharacterized protein n=1 Tax=Dendrobium catenatum TaxID=906689 RepID=A0A2I0WH33_9ASPA|nr:hypothetical protein MA16_Dca020179 [Dendrobium catenatum]
MELVNNFYRPLLRDLSIRRSRRRPVINRLNHLLIGALFSTLICPGRCRFALLLFFNHKINRQCWALSQMRLESFGNITFVVDIVMWNLKQRDCYRDRSCRLCALLVSDDAMKIRE